MDSKAKLGMIRKHGLDLYVVIVNRQIVHTFWSEFTANNRCAMINAKVSK